MGQRNLRRGCPDPEPAGLTVSRDVIVDSAGNNPIVAAKRLLLHHFDLGQRGARISLMQGMGATRQPQSLRPAKQCEFDSSLRLHVMDDVCR